MILEDVENRLGSKAISNELRLDLKDADRAVGKALTALDRLGVPIKRATLSPGMGSTAILRVELSQPLKTDQISRLVKQLLVVKSIQRVDTTALQIDSTKEPAPSDLDDDMLLQDLNEPENSHPPEEKV